MKKYLILFFVIIFYSFSISAQKAVDLFESTFKLKANSEEIFYYGFAKGDQIVFNFTEEDNKDIKEIEIAEYPSYSKFIDYKSSSIFNKTISVSNTGIYTFRFNNSSISGRICKVKIQRIPCCSSTQNFNTNVFWRSGVDSILTSKKEKYLVKSDTAIISIVDQVSKVSSRNAINGNANNSLIEFSLPDNTVLWSYYIGVGKEGKEVYNKSKDRLISTAFAVVSKFSGYGTLAALALYGVNTFTQAQGGDNVKYYLIKDKNNTQLFKEQKPFDFHKQADVVSDAAQMKTPLKGPVYLGLTNDNLIEPIEVIVKVTAITVKQEWGSRFVKEIIPNEKKEPYLKK
ncbi:MAG: hypothetical protein WCK02_01555 [Bacteroidota bacterium]